MNCTLCNQIHIFDDDNPFHCLACREKMKESLLRYDIQYVDLTYVSDASKQTIVIHAKCEDEAIKQLKENMIRQGIPIAISSCNEFEEV